MIRSRAQTSTCVGVLGLCGFSTNPEAVPAVDEENFPKAIKWEDMVLKKENCVPGWELERG